MILQGIGPIRPDQQTIDLAFELMTKAHLRKVYLVALLLTLQLFSSDAKQIAKTADQPNILFCFADDWGRYASIFAEIEKSPSLNQIVKTPNIDRVAREGVLFRNAFVNAPSCTPSRSSLLSGRYFFNTGRGAILREARWDTAIPSFPLLLRDAGYHIGETYKVWSPGSPVDAPFGAGKYEYEKAGKLPNDFSENVTDMIAKGSSLAEAREKIFAQVRGNFDDFLADRKAGQPFLYFFGATTTHRRWIKGSGKALWGINPDSLKGKLPAFLPDVPEIREDVADYLGEVQAWDAYVGLLLKRLEETGELEKTLIVVSGDHGMPGVTNGKCNLYDFGTGVALAVRVPGVKGGRIVDDLVSLPDLAPTFLEAAGIKPPDKLNSRSLWNLLQSGKSGQVEANRNWVISGRERHVHTARANFESYPQRALRTPEFLYIRNFAPDRWPMGDPKGVTPTSAPSGQQLEEDTYAGFADMDASPTKAWLVAHRNYKKWPKWRRYYDYAFAKRPAEELFDLRKDPQQMKNLAADPAYAKQKAKLSAQLMTTLKEAGDPRVGNDPQGFERMLFVDDPKAPQTSQALRLSTPEAQGVDSEQLALAIETARQSINGIHSLLVIRNGALVAEAYFHPYDGKTPHDVASVTKSVTTTLAGIAIAQGKIKSAKDPMLNYFPGVNVANRDQRKANVRLDHLMTMSSGLDCKAARGEPTLWEMLAAPNDVRHMLDLPMVAEPGANFVYCSGGMHLLSAVIAKATGISTEAFARRALFQPLAIQNFIWPADHQGVAHGFGNLHLLPRDMAKLGLLALNRGNWQGKQIIPESWVEQATKSQKTTGNARDYGFGWWIPKPGGPIAFEASGRGGQQISVLPDLNAVIVLTGGGFSTGDVMKLVLPAIKPNTTLPANPSGVAKLKAAIAEAAKAPATKPAVPLPELAKAISGKTFELGTNWIGLKTLSLTFTTNQTATARLTFVASPKQYQFGRSAKIQGITTLSETRAIGLNGVPIVSGDGPMALPVAVSGYWIDGQTFFLEYDEIANTNCYRLRLKFSGGTVSVQAKERTGLFDENFAGKVVLNQPPHSH